jgi:hypothetical protein
LEITFNGAEELLIPDDHTSSSSATPGGHGSVIAAGIKSKSRAAATAMARLRRVFEDLVAGKDRGGEEKSRGRAHTPGATEGRYQTCRAGDVERIIKIWRTACANTADVYGARI